MKTGPELRVGLQFYLEAFFDLDSDRQHGKSLGPIPWKSIKGYAEAFELDEEQTADLFFFLRQMDTDHLKRIAAKRKDRAKNGPNAARPVKKNAPRRS